MHIGIDGSRCGGKNSTGVERYSALLLPELIKLLVRQGHKVTVYARKNSKLFEGAHVRVLNAPRFWTHLVLGPLSQLDDVDCLFVSSHVLPFLRPKKCVVVLHDICFEQYPLAYSFFDRWYLRLTSADAARRAKIITHSTSTSEKIKKIYNADKVFVVPPAAMPVTNQEIALLWRKPYLLFMGRIEEKKNIKTLIIAFDKLLSKRSDIKHNLVLLGKNGYGFSEIHKLHAGLRFRDRIFFQGYVSDEIKDEALREASGIVLPSLCEGTSLVLLEARTARVPFASTFCRACKEAGGQTGIYVTKNNVESWVNALESLIESPLSPDPAPSRSWAQVAEEVAQVITE